jgi:hypothetical protein
MPPLSKSFLRALLLFGCITAKAAHVLIEDPAKNFVVIMKDGNVYKILLR